MEFQGKTIRNTLSRLPRTRRPKLGLAIFCSVLLLGTTLRFLLSVTNPGRAESPPDFVEEPRAPAMPTLPSTITLETPDFSSNPMGKLRISVLDIGTAEPLEDAELTVWAADDYVPVIRLETPGQFEVDSTLLAGEALVRISAPGHAGTHAVVGQETHWLTAELAAFSSLEVRVVGVDHEELQALEIILELPSWAVAGSALRTNRGRTLVSKCGASGQALFSQLLPGTGYVARIKPHGILLPISKAAEVLLEDSSIELRARSGSAIIGSILGCDGRAAEDFRVTCKKSAIRFGLRGLAIEAQATTRSDGSFMLAGITPGKKLLQIRRVLPNDLIESIALGVNLEPGEVHDCGILEPARGGAYIEGVVVDVGQNALKDVLVCIKSKETDYRVDYRSRTGFFRVCGVPPGEVFLSASHASGFASTRLLAFEGHAEDIVLTIHNRAENYALKGIIDITIRIAGSQGSGLQNSENSRNSGSGSSMPADPRAYARDGRGKWIPVAQPGAEDSSIIRCGPLQAGPYDLTLLGDGFVSMPTHVEVSEGSTTQYEVFLLPCVPQTGIVLSEDGKPLRAILCRLLGDDSPRTEWNTSEEIETDAEGKFVLKLLAVGESGRIVVRSRGHRSRIIGVNSNDNDLRIILEEK